MIESPPPDRSAGAPVGETHSREAAEQTAAKSSYRQILGGTSLMGAAQLMGIVIGLLRTKAIAMLLGPAGIGLIGILSQLLATISAVALLGLNMSGVRSVAEAHGAGDQQKVALIARALRIGTGLVALATATLGWIYRNAIAAAILGNRDYADAVGWVAIGVGITVLIATQTALLNGARRLNDMAALQVFSALAITGISLPMFFLWGAAAIPAYIVMGPAVLFLLGAYFVRRVPLERTAFSPWPTVVKLIELLRFGVPLMGATIAVSVALLFIQADIKSTLGVDALGLYVASNTIAMQSVGLILGAMAADYYPRLTATIDDLPAAHQLINQQTEIALLLSAPILMATFSLAPLIMTLFYTNDFAEAASVMQWQIAGTFLKIITWPIGFVMLAQKRGWLFMLLETISVAVMAGASALLIRQFGVVGAGMGYFFAYVAYFVLVCVFVLPGINFMWGRRVRGYALAPLLGLAMLTGLTLLLTHGTFEPGNVLPDGFDLRDFGLGSVTLSGIDWDRIDTALSVQILGALMSVAMAVWSLHQLITATGFGARFARFGGPMFSSRSKNR